MATDHHCCISIKENCWFLELTHPRVHSSCSSACQLTVESGFWPRSRTQQLTPANLCRFQHALDFYLPKWITSNLARLFIAVSPSSSPQTPLPFKTHRMFHLMTQRTQHFGFVCRFAL